MKRDLVRPIHGIITPLVTPLTEQGQLDLEGLQRLIAHVTFGGVHGLFILGTTGEGPSLCRKIQESVIRHTSQYVDGDLPVFVGITHPSLNESLSLSCTAADAGCDAVVVAPPYYFDLQQQEFITYCRRLSQESPLPVVLYNMPAVTGISISPETVRQLVVEEAIVGIKDSSGDLEYFRELLSIGKTHSDFPVIVGPEHLLAETLALGGVGGVTGGANIWPDLFVKLYEAVLDGASDHVSQLAELVSRLGQIYTVGAPSVSATVARTKTAISILGLCGDNMAAPIVRTNEQQRRKIESFLEDLDILDMGPTGHRRYILSL